MPRPPSLTPNDRLTIAIDASLKARMQIILYSELEQSVPRGAWQQFIESRLREWLDWRRQPLEAFGFPAGYFITGPAEMVQAVVNKLKG